MSAAGHPAIPVRVDVPWRESCDCCGRTAEQIGQRRNWSQLGAGQTRELSCPSCREFEAARARGYSPPEV